MEGDQPHHRRYLRVALWRRRQRVRRSQQDASQEDLLVDAAAVVPALSLREQALMGPEHVASGKLPWITGRQRWMLPDSVAVVLSGNDPRKQLISGLSGHTSRGPMPRTPARGVPSVPWDRGQSRERRA